MSTITKILSLSKEDFYKKHLLIINHILPVQMSTKQAEVLAAFISLEGELEKHRFSTLGRKLVMEKTGLDPGGLGNYLRFFKDNNYVIENPISKKLEVISILIPNSKIQTYQFKLIAND